MSATYMGDIIEPEIIGIHDRPGIHSISDDGWCIAAQIIVDQSTISHIWQTIDGFQCFASL